MVNCGELIPSDLTLAIWYLMLLVMMMFQILSYKNFPSGCNKTELKIVRVHLNVVPRSTMSTNGGTEN